MRKIYYLPLGSNPDGQTVGWHKSSPCNEQVHCFWQSLEWKDSPGCFKTPSYWHGCTSVIKDLRGWKDGYQNSLISCEPNSLLTI